MVSSHLTTLRFKTQALEMFSSQVHGKIWVVIRQVVVLSFSADFSTLSSQVYTENNVEDHFLLFRLGGLLLADARLISKFVIFAVVAEYYVPFHLLREVTILMLHGNLWQF